MAILIARNLSNRSSYRIWVDYTRMMKLVRSWQTQPDLNGTTYAVPNRQMQSKSALTYINTPTFLYYRIAAVSIYNETSQTLRTLRRHDEDLKRPFDAVLT